VVCHNRRLESERPYEKTFLVEDHTIINRLEKKILRSNTTTIHARKIKRIIQNQDIDCIHSHFGPNGIKMQEMLLKMGLEKIPHVISFHGMDINRLPHEDDNYKDKLLELNKYSTTFTCPSSFLKQKMIQLGLDEDKINVIPNCVNNIFLKNFNHSSKTEVPEKFKLLNVGRLVSVKGQIYLLDALKILLENNYNVTLTIVGEGNLRNKLIKRSQELNIGNYVKFTGKMPHNEVVDIMNGNDIYIHSSIKNRYSEEESFGLAVLEAIAMGLPAVVTNTGGTPEIVANTNAGYIVPSENPQNIANAIMKIIQNFRSLKNNPNTKEKVESFYTFIANKNKWLKTYQKH